MEEKKLIECTFCKTPDGKLNLFKEETLKKCLIISRQRKIHNLKFKDIVLPDDWFHSGYHSQCYKFFTALKKKYYSDPETTQKTTAKIAKHISSASTSIPSIISNSNDEFAYPSGSLCHIEPKSHEKSEPAVKLEYLECCVPLKCFKDPSPQSNIFFESSESTDENEQFLAFTSSPHIVSIAHDPLASCESTVESKLVKPSPSNSDECSVPVDSFVDSPSQSNILFERSVSTDANKPVCVYCDRKRKNHKSRMLPLHESVKSKFVQKLNERDQDYAELIEKALKVTGSKIYYHSKCQLDYSNKILSNKKTAITSWHYLRHHHKVVFNKVCGFIQQNVINKGQCFLLTNLHRYYTELLKQEVGESMEMGNFTKQCLEAKIKKAFNRETKMLIHEKKKFLTPKTVIHDKLTENIKDEDILHRAALILRKSIMLSNIETLKERKVSLPPELSNFYFTLIAGSNNKRKKSLQCIRQVQSLGQDVAFAVYNDIND